MAVNLSFLPYEVTSLYKGSLTVRSRLGLGQGDVRVVLKTTTYHLWDLGLIW